MPLDGWLTRARDTAAACAGLSPDGLGIEDAEVTLLLELAGVAAHESGDRRNAPLLCYVLGRARQGATLEELGAAIRQMPSMPPGARSREGAG
jgi:hypothetical protein